jgi:hypothetical protein
MLNDQYVEVGLMIGFFLFLGSRFLRGCVPGSLHLPYQTAFEADGRLAPCPEADKLLAARGKIIVVAGNRGSLAAVQV